MGDNETVDLLSTEIFTRFPKEVTRIFAALRYIFVNDDDPHNRHLQIPGTVVKATFKIDAEKYIQRLEHDRTSPLATTILKDYIVKFIRCFIKHTTKV